MHALAGRLEQAFAAGMAGADLGTDGSIWTRGVGDASGHLDA